MTLIAFLCMVCINGEMLSLTVTEANYGAVELYKRLGYTVQRVFDAFVWEG